MTKEQYIKNLSVPKGKIDVVLDTDAFNEIDDQFAISYLIRSTEKLNTKAIYAAPFHNANSTGPADGMEKSYEEIKKLQELLGSNIPTFKGSESYLKDEKTPVISPAAKDLAERAKQYSPENPLYVVAIGAITNVASAILLNPKIAENTVVVWLGGHAHHFCDTKEFNMYQDIAAARIVMGCGVPFVQLPCLGVVSSFTFSRPELEYWLVGKNSLTDYLAKNVISSAESYAAGKPWTRVIWDVTAVAWLLNDGERFMKTKLINTRLPDYNGYYCPPEPTLLCNYAYFIVDGDLKEDLIKKLCR